MQTGTAGQALMTTSSPATIDIRNFSFFYDTFQALDGISLTISQKRITALIGASGSGLGHRGDNEHGAHQQHTEIPQADADAEHEINAADVHSGCTRQLWRLPHMVLRDWSAISVRDLLEEAHRHPVEDYTSLVPDAVSPER
jgi:ABC-type uncharacterized transport system ATPase subunit